MFSVGEKAIYTRFVWATEENETEQVRVTHVVDENSVYIENTRKTIKRAVRVTELTKIPRPTPFGTII
jgi:hypothetical protein